FLQKSADLLKGTSGERAISDFLKFIGDGKTEDPLVEFETKDGYVPDLQQASAVLENPYFLHWVFTTEELTGFIEELEKKKQDQKEKETSLIMSPAEFAAQQQRKR